MTSTTSDDGPEVFYKAGMYYSVTINPADQYQFAGKLDRLSKVRSMFYEMFLPLKQLGIDYYFVIELSEPRTMMQGSLGPRYHLHGWVRMVNKGIYNLLNHVLYGWTRIGIVDIDTIKDLSIWKKYMKKQSHIFQSHRVNLSNGSECSQGDDNLDED